MTKKELLEKLKYVKDDAVIYIEADHGQQAEMGSRVFYFVDYDNEYEGDLPYYGEDLEWGTRRCRAEAVLIS